MADSKLTGLNELTTPANNDLLYVVDDPTGSAESKKITYSNIISNASIVASQVTDFDTEVSNNTDVTANTAKISYTDAADVAANTAARHVAITVNDSATFDFDLTGQLLTGSVIQSAIDHDVLTNTHNLTTDIDHNSLTNTHNLTTSIDHNTITNNHNLTTDIDHNTITNNHNLTTDIDHDTITNTHNLTTDVDHATINNLNSTNYTHLTAANHTDLTDGNDSTLHYHATDRARSNHTGTQTASTISDFDTEVSNNVSVVANTAKVSNANHTGDVTGSTALTIAAGAVDIPMLSASGTANSTTYLRGDNTWSSVAGGAGEVSSVFTRTGDVVAATNDYTWAQIDKTTSDIADITTKSHTSLTDIGTNTHAQIDTAITNSTNHIANTSNPHQTTVDNLNNVTITSVTDGEILQYKTDGTQWVNQTFTEADIATATDLTTHTGNDDIHFEQSSISIPASQISDFDTEVSNNTDVAANTAARHDAVTVSDTASIDLTLTGQQVSGVVLPAGVDHNSLNNTHNLTTDINHNTITNNHNLTTDIDHNALTNYLSSEHFQQSSITTVGTVTTGTWSADALVAGKVPNHDDLNGYVADEHIAESALSITASQVSDFDTEVSNNTSVTANTAKVTNATHTGEVTGATTLTIASNIVDEDNLKVSNSPSDGQFLQYKDVTDQLTWATPSGGASSSISAGDTSIEITDTGSDGKISFDVDGTEYAYMESANIYFSPTAGDSGFQIVDDGSAFAVATFRAYNHGDSTATTLQILGGDVTLATGGGTFFSCTDEGLLLGDGGARASTILDEDDMTSDSATALATQQSIKKYVDDEIDGLGTGANVNISVGTTAPASPSTNDLWVDTN